MGDVFRPNCRCGSVLKRVYGIALDMYLSGEDGPRGCFTVMTATSEAVYDPDIRKLVLSGPHRDGPLLCAFVQDGASARRTAASADPDALAQLASATIHTIAIRARAQVPRKELEAIVKGAIEVMLRA